MDKYNDLISRADAIKAVEKNACNTQRTFDAINSLPSAEQVTGKLKKPCNTLLTDNVGGCKEKKSKLDLVSRQDAIEAVVCHIWHTPNEVYRQFNCENVVREVVEDAIKRIQSAETLQNLTKPNKTYEDDIIRRQDAIDAVKQAIYNHDSAIMRITSLPSASVEVGEWIPCSERLPSKDGRYLIVGRQGAVNILPYHDGRWYGRWGVIAWMPLPKPYGEDGEA